MRIRQRANTTDRRLVEFKFVSFLKPGVDLTHRRHLDFTAISLTTTLWYFYLDLF
jgi:hypothetical protein